MRVEIITDLTKLPRRDIHAEGLAAFFGTDDGFVVAAYDGERLAGWLPMKRVTEEVMGFNGIKLCRASNLHGHVDEACARHLLEFLVRNEKFSLLELGGETENGPLARAAEGLEGFALNIERVPGKVRASVSIGRDLDAWFHSLDGWAASLARRTRSLMAAGEIELVTSEDVLAGKELLAMYKELEARSYKIDAATGVSADARKAARQAALAEAGSTLFHFLLLDGLPIAGSLSLRVGRRVVQMEGVCDMSFEDTAPEEVLLMLEVRDAINRGCSALQLSSDLVSRSTRLGATSEQTQVLQLFRRFGAHHLDSVRRVFTSDATVVPLHNGPMRSDLAKQLRARTHATEIFDRLDSAGAAVERLWGDPLRASLPFDTFPPEYERVRRAV